MRTIKFRGRDFEGVWRHGLLVFNYDTCAVIGIHNSVNGDLRQHIVDPETVGQFTGLLDTDGAEIYEGDIIVYSSWATRYEGEVCFDDGSFKVKLGGGFGDMHESFKYSRVIGNIHDQKKQKPE